MASTSPWQRAGLKRLLEDEDNLVDDPVRKRLKMEIDFEVRQLIIPANGHCSVKHEYSVYVDEYKHPWDAKLVHSVAGAKDNDFYHLQLLIHKSRQKYITWVGQGLIGQQPREFKPKPTSDLIKGKAEFEKKFMTQTGYSWWERFQPPASSSGKGFRFIPPSYVVRNQFDPPFNFESARNIAYNIPLPECTLPAAIQGVMALILDKSQLLAGTVDYDAQKLPLGVLNTQTLVSGWRVLNELENSLDSVQASAMTPAALSSQYYSIIPHVFGYTYTPVISTRTQIVTERKLLEELFNALTARDIIDGPKSDYTHPLEVGLRKLKLKQFQVLNHNSNEFLQIEAYYTSTINPHSGTLYKIIDIFHIERPREESRYTNSLYSRHPQSNRRLLWHGSKTVNFASILSGGLRIQPKGIARRGTTLGKGVYFSDNAWVSLQYCAAATVPPTDTDTALLLLADVELGESQVLTGASPLLRPGFKPTTDSTLWNQSNYAITTFQDGEHIHPRLAGVKVPYRRWPEQVLYYWPTEYAVYNLAQIRLRYLVFVKRG
ncbi:poly polymerase catalytic domain-containing protein [Aspergillus multicolor]|uniref:poly polymerase catalytic domain-containing protein n=1 Tax=Aspergillus multicolor TaxID=41759 RepID=UPI003CCE2CE4